MSETKPKLKSPEQQQMPHRLQIAAQLLAAKMVYAGDRLILDNAVDNSLIAADRLIAKHLEKK